MFLSDTEETDATAGLSTGEDAADSAMTVAEWVATRPVTGAVTMIVGGLLIAWPSLQFLLQARVVESGSRIAFGVPVGTLAVAGGMVVLSKPAYASKIGLGALLVSAVSFVVAFGGFLVGMVATGVGGLLCFAWSPPTEE